jgi:DNA processing protein
VVVEAREASGALITADLALEEGREVFAVPGEITSSLSAGSNALLRLGATPLTSSADVLETFGLEPAPRAATAVLDDEAERLLGRIRDGPCTADELARASGLSADRLGVLLSELELAGVVHESAGIYRAV